MSDQPNLDEGTTRWRLPAQVAIAFFGYALLWVLLAFLLDRLWLRIDGGGLLPHLFLDVAFIVLISVTLFRTVRRAQREARQSATRLESSEERYRQLFQDSLAVLVLIDPDTGQLVDANPAACRYYGYSHAELMALNIADIDTRPLSEVAVTVELARDSDRHLEVRHRLASGEERDVEVFATPITIAGQPRIYTIVHDVSARFAVERTLRATLDQVENLNRVSQALVVAEDIDQLLRAFAAPIYDKGHCTVILYAVDSDEDGRPVSARLEASLRDQSVKNLVSLDVVERLTLSDWQFTEQVIHTSNNIIVIPNMDHPPKGIDQPLVDLIRRYKVKTVAFVPLTSVSGAGVGLVVFSWTRPYELTPLEARLYRVLSIEFATHLANLRLVRQTREQAAFREQLLTNSPLGFCACDRSGRIIEANPAFSKLLGYERPELLSLPPFHIAPPERRDSFRQSFERIWAGDEVDPADDELMRRDGQRVPVRLHYNLLRNPEGGIDGALTLVEDLTRRRKTEAALRQTESRLRLVFEQSQVGMLLVDLDGQIMQVNPAFTEFVGYHRGDLLGRSLRAITHPDDWESDWQQTQAAVNGDVPSYTVEKRYLRRDGATVWGRLTVSVMYEDAEPVAVFRMVQDITTEREQRRLAEALRETAAVINSSLDIEEVLEGILDRVGDLLPYDVANLFRVDADQVVLERSRRRGDGPEQPIREGLTFGVTDFDSVRRLIEFERGVVIPDTEKMEGLRPDAFDEQIDMRSHIGAPVVVDGAVTGLLHLASIQPDVYSQKDLGPLSVFAGQAAVALKNARLYESERRQLQITETLREVGGLLTSRLSLDEVLDRILDLLSTVVAYDSVSVQLLADDGDLLLIQSRGFPDPVASEEAARRVLSATIRSRWKTADVIVMPDTSNDPRWIPLEGSYIRSWIGAALRVRGKLIGVLNVDSGIPNTYDEATARTVLAFANQAAIAIENVRLYTESQERNDRLTILNQITRIGTATLDLDELLAEMVNVAADIIGGDSCHITLWDEQKGVPRPAAASGDYHDTYRSLHVEPGEGTISGRVLEAGEPLFVHREGAADLMSESVQSRFAPGMAEVASFLGLPMFVGARRVGVLIIGFNQPHDFTSDEVAWASQAAELVGLTIARAQVYSELEARVEIRTAELSSANAQLSALSEIKDEFVANVSHELRTPIASIKLYHHLLTARPDKQAQYLTRLDQETDRLERIIEDLLFLSRMDQGELESTRVPVDVNELVGMYVIDRATQASSRGLDLVFEPYAEHLSLHGDGQALGRMVSSLIANALSYTDRGDRVTVRTALRRRDDRQHIVIEVEDTGPGIPPEEQIQVFDRFYRGTSGRETGAPGTGLGLAISKEIAERHGGGIALISPVDDERGARFVIWLPINGADS